jgi:hypothetical protein
MTFVLAIAFYSAAMAAISLSNVWFADWVKRHACGLPTVATVKSLYHTLQNYKPPVHTDRRLLFCAKNSRNMYSNACSDCKIQFNFPT